jgi:hypothetical protein
MVAPKTTYLCPLNSGGGVGLIGVSVMQSIQDQQIQTLDQKDDAEIHLHITYASHFDMDEAFCTRMRAAIAVGLESAPIGVITAPGTKHPRYVLTETLPLASSLSDMDR